MSPETWRQRHSRNSIAAVRIAERNQAPRRKRTSRSDTDGDASGDIAPDRTTRRWHRPAPAIARAAPPLRERRVGRLPPQRLRPISWLAFSCLPPESIQVSRQRAANSLDLRFNDCGCAPFHILLVADVAIARLKMSAERLADRSLNRGRQVYPLSVSPTAIVPAVTTSP